MRSSPSRGSACALMVMALLAASMPVAAGHGAPYALIGTATLTGLIVWEFTAVLKWQGAGVFQLTIFAGPEGSALPTFFIVGHEEFAATFFAARDWCPRTEVTEGYRAVDDLTGGDQFEARGLVYEVCFGGAADGDRRLELEGHYLGLFDLHFAGSGWV